MIHLLVFLSGFIFAFLLFTLFCIILFIRKKKKESYFIKQYIDNFNLLNNSEDIDNV